MKFFFSIFFFVTACMASLNAGAQHLSAGELIKAWSASDTSQTTKAEATYADLKLYTDASTFRQRMNELNAFVRKHPSQRLAARITMYEILGKLNLSKPLSGKDNDNIKNAIQIADLLNDSQLLSEIYTLYGEHFLNGQESGLFYIAKALGIQEKIGLEHFPFAYHHFLIESFVLYGVEDYGQSIGYARQALQLIPPDSSNLRDTTHLRDSIYLLDFIGASYKALGVPNSVIYYYKEMQQVLSRYSDTGLTKIWNGVAKGGIAQGLFLQKKYGEAYPLLLENIQSSVETQQWGDAALAQNTAAQINFINRQYDSSLYRSKQAYGWASEVGDLHGTVTALQNIAAAYKALGKYDSAYFYNDKYHLYNDTLQKQIGDNRLAVINTRIEYGDMQASLKDAQNSTASQIRLRNYILAGIALLALICWLLYNRYRLRQRLRRELLEKETRRVKRQIAEAQQQLDIFSRNISEKNKLIEMLQSRISNADTATLSNFTILTEDQWQNFKDNFEKVYPGYWLRLIGQLPELTTGEQRFMALAKLGMSNKEIGAATGVSPQSIRVTIHRLRKKINIPEADDVRDIAQHI